MFMMTHTAATPTHIATEGFTTSALNSIISCRVARAKHLRSSACISLTHLHDPVGEISCCCSSASCGFQPWSTDFLPDQAGDKMRFEEGQEEVENVKRR